MSRQSNNQPTTFNDLLAPPGGTERSSKKPTLFSPVPVQRSVFILSILTILFAAAFIALLIFHLSQRQVYEAQIDHLEDSYDLVRDANEFLRKQLDSQTTVIQDIQELYEMEKKNKQYLKDSVEEFGPYILPERELLEIIIQFQQGNYEGCADLIIWLSNIPYIGDIQWENNGVSLSLKDTNYMEQITIIQEELVKQGYLEEPITLNFFGPKLYVTRYPDHIECNWENLWTD